MPDRRNVTLSHPQYGPVRSFAAFALLVLVVEHATRAFVDTLAVVAPSADPELLRLAMAATLWVAFAATAAAEVKRQVGANPQRFIAREVLVEFCEQHRPTPRWHALALVATGAGAAVVYVGWDRVFATLDDALLVGKRLAETGELGHFSAANLAWGVAFVVGYALLSWGADRLIVGGLRELQYRVHRRRTEPTTLTAPGD